MQTHFEPRHLARTNDPDTSHAAASRVVEFGVRHHQIICRVLSLGQGAGLTVHEIAKYCNLTPHAIGKRLAYMQARWQVELVFDDNGDVLTRLSPTGRAARVWKLKEVA